MCCSQMASVVFVCFEQPGVPDSTRVFMLFINKMMLVYVHVHMYADRLSLYIASFTFKVYVIFENQFMKLRNINRHGLYSPKF